MKIDDWLPAAIIVAALWLSNESPEPESDDFAVLGSPGETRWLLWVAAIVAVLWLGIPAERGAVLYELNGKVRKGQIIEGDRTGVKIPLKIPAGAKRTGLWHSHNGDFTPSERDVLTAKRLGVPIFIECNGVTKMAVNEAGEVLV